MATLKMEKWERWFLYATTVVLVAFFIAIIASIGEAGIHLPTDEGQVDPAAVAAGQVPPFDNPGVTQLEDGTYQAVFVAQAWSFTPSEIELPVGAEVEFVVTSTDVIHGFLIAERAVNGMIIPGQILKVSATFDEAGVYNIICHEYCGLLHSQMFGQVKVEGEG
jgi:cytochrome c oxidase subunit 2